jgi:hypothetical protein
MPDSTKKTGSATSYKTSPYMNEILGAAKNIFNTGQAWAPDTSSHVTPFATQTSQALGGLQNAATGSQGAFDQNFNRVSATLAQGGLNDRQTQSANWLQNIAAGGEMQNNPYLEDTINRGSQDIANSTNLMASLGGRYGSGGHEGVLQNSIGDFAGGLRFQDYGNQQARRDAAMRDYFNIGSQERANVMQGGQDLTNAYNAKLTPWQTLGKVGSAYEAKNQQVLDDKARIFDETQAGMRGPVDWLANLANAYQGGGAVQSKEYNPAANAVSGAIKGYDIFGGPIGAAAGGLAGYFG